MTVMERGNLFTARSRKQRSSEIVRPFKSTAEIWWHENMSDEIQLMLINREKSAPTGTSMSRDISADILPQNEPGWHIQNNSSTRLFRQQSLLPLETRFPPSTGESVFCIMQSFIKSDVRHPDEKRKEKLSDADSRVISLYFPFNFSVILIFVLISIRRNRASTKVLLKHQKLSLFVEKMMQGICHVLGYRLTVLTLFVAFTPPHLKSTFHYQI